MPTNEKSCISKWCQEIWAILKGFAIVIFAQLIGWVIFSYVEDDVNVIDCFVNPKKVADKVYPLSNETERANVLFSKLYDKTGQVLTLNQSAAMYYLFRTHFNVPDEGVFLNSDRAFRGCVKWYRFSVVTMTTIGFGVVTAKTSLGKLLVIPYALVTIPVMLSFLSFIGSLISSWAEATILFVQKCVKGNNPLRCKELKRCIYLFTTFWIISIIVMLNYFAIPTAFESTGAMRWLDGIYFLFVTFSTIGFGDMTGPAQDPTFFMWNFVLGLAAISGFTDSLISLISSIEFAPNRGHPCCFIECKGDGDDDDGTADNGNGNEEEVNIPEGATNSVAHL